MRRKKKKKKRKVKGPIFTKRLSWSYPSSTGTSLLQASSAVQSHSGLRIPAELAPIDSRELDKLTQVKAQGKQVQREELWCKTNPSNASVEGT